MDLTIKEFADSKGVTYESVRQLVVKNNDKLEGEIYKNGKTYLTDKAQEILSQNMRKRNVTIISNSAEETESKKEIERLNARIEMLERKHKEEIDQKDKALAEMQERYNKETAEYLEKTKAFTDEIKSYVTQQAKMLETQTLYLEQKNIAEKEKDILQERTKNIAMNRKERRKFLKEIKRKEKEQNQ